MYKINQLKLLDEMLYQKLNFQQPTISIKWDLQYF